MLLAGISDVSVAFQIELGDSLDQFLKLGLHLARAVREDIHAG
jgi:hypothetical protein